MKKFTMFLVSMMLVAFSSVAFADDLNVTFEDDTDVANWSHYDEDNWYTVEEWNATAGVDGSGALQLSDAGYTFLAKRPVSTEVGADFTLTMDVKTSGWGATRTVFVDVETIADVDSVEIITYTTFTSIEITGTATASDGYIRIYGLQGGDGQDTVWVDNVVFDDGIAGPDLFFSEYIEGSNSNKALEIFNPTSSDVDLAGYSVVGFNNGATDPTNTMALTGTLAAGEVYVIGNASAWQEILDQTDVTSAVTYYNGDDAVVLFHGTDSIDIIGIVGVDPGSNWPVAGDGSTGEYTLVRKETVTMGTTDWAASAGTNADDSQWIVYPQNTFDYIGAHPGMPQGPVSITFRVNSSTVEGFTDSTHTLQVRGGAHNLADDSWHNIVLQWNDQSLPMTNVGGDYWEATVVYPDTLVGWEVNWKVGATVAVEGGGTEDFWESNDNRPFILPTADDTTELAFVSHGFDPPYTASDSVDVFFRVNMSANNSFNSETGQVYIVGAFPNQDGSENMWVPDKFPLTREADSDYFNYHLKLAAGQDSTQYRFTLGSWDGSEQIYGHGMYPDNENRGAAINGDTTLAWKWWNDAAPQGATGEDTVQVTFTADLTSAINSNGFNIGDTLIVQYGYNGTAEVQEDTLLNVFLTNLYRVTSVVENVEAGASVQYAYFKEKNGQRIRDTFYDFTDPEVESQQNRKALIPAEINHMDNVDIDDTVASLTDMHRMPEFKNTSAIAQNVLVTYTCDLRPAYFQVLLGGDTLISTQNSEWFIYPTEEDSVFAWGVYMNGPGNGEDGWQPWNETGLADHIMYDDATHGDMTAGDSIYAIQVLFSPDSGDYVGQEFKFGIQGEDSEAGNGQGFGLNHFENIDDGQTEYTIHSSYGSINPTFYDRWDFDNGELATSIDNEVGVVRSSRLVGNYPNPFNPVTTIRFELAKVQDVKLVIYDVTGREVTRLLNGPQRQGVHKVLWNGIDSRGNAVSTGVYFYRLNTDNYSKTMKMILMK